MPTVSGIGLSSSPEAGLSDLLGIESFDCSKKIKPKKESFRKHDTGIHIVGHSITDVSVNGTSERI